MLVGLRFRRLDELMEHRQNGTAFPSTAMLTLCAVEFNAVDTDPGDAAAASRRRRYMTETHTHMWGVKMP